MSTDDIYSEGWEDAQRAADYCRSLNGLQPGSATPQLPGSIDQVHLSEAQAENPAPEIIKVIRRRDFYTGTVHYLGQRKLYPYHDAGDEQREAYLRGWQDGLVGT